MEQGSGPAGVSCSHHPRGLPRPSPCLPEQTAPWSLMPACLQVETVPQHRGWRAAGLLLLLALATVGAVAGGLLGFAHTSPEVSPPGTRVGTAGGRARALEHAARGPAGWEEAPRGHRGPVGAAPGCPVNSSFPPATAAGAPPDPPEPPAQGQPNHPGRRSPERSHHRGDAPAEQQELGRAVRRAECEWAGRGRARCWGRPTSPTCFPRVACVTAPRSTGPASSA